LDNKELIELYFEAIKKEIQKDYILNDFDITDNRFILNRYPKLVETYCKIYGVEPKDIYFPNLIKDLSMLYENLGGNINKFFRLLPSYTEKDFFCQIFIMLIEGIFEELLK
jgi:hypothetical protein